MIWVLDKCIDWRQGVHVHQIGMVGPIQIGATGHWRDSYALGGHMCVMCMQRSCCLIFYHVNIVWKPCDCVMCIPYGGKEVPYICICMYMWMPLTNACLPGFIWLHHLTTWRAPSILGMGHSVCQHGSSPLHHLSLLRGSIAAAGRPAAAASSRAPARTGYVSMLTDLPRKAKASTSILKCPMHSRLNGFLRQRC